MLEEQGFGDEVAEEVNELEGGVGGDGVGNAGEGVEGHGGVDEGDDGDVELEGLVEDGGLAVGVDDDDAVGGLGGAEAELLVAGTELLGGVAVGEEAAGAPEGVGGGGVGAEAPRHQLEDVVEERVGVDEHEPPLLPCQRRHEVARAPHAYQRLVGVDDRHLVAEPIRVHLEVMRRHPPTTLRIRAQQLLYHDRMDRHSQSAQLNLFLSLSVSRLDCDCDWDCDCDCDDDDWNGFPLSHSLTHSSSLAFGICIIRVLVLVYPLILTPHSLASFFFPFFLLTFFYPKTKKKLTRKKCFCP